jgi:hypothetical protein
MSFSNKMWFNHHWVIQGYNETLDEKSSKLVPEPYPMFEFGQGKNSVQVVVGNIFVFEKELETTGAAQRKYMNHQTKKNCLNCIICVNVPNYRYQCINYRYYIWIQLF